MAKRPALLLAILPLFCLSLSARAVEIPADTTSNCVQGVFGKNAYVALKEASVPDWPDVKGRDKIDLITATFDFREISGGPAEKIAVVFSITDHTGETQITSPMKGLASSSGTLRLQWNLRDRSGRRVDDGVYRVKVDIFGQHHGNLLTNAMFPLYIATEKPELSEPKISPSNAVQEYGGGPVVGFTLNTTCKVIISELNDQGREIDRSEPVFGIGKQSVRSDMKDKKGELMEPGDYMVKISAENQFGASETFVYRYSITEPPDLRLGVTLDRIGKLQAKDDLSTPFTITLNQPAYVTVEHVDDSGLGDYIGKSTDARPAVFYPKGKHKLAWRRINREDNTRYTSGSHHIRATAVSMSGEEAAAETDPIKLDAGPTKLKTSSSKNEPQLMEQLAIRKRPSISVAITPETLPLGDEMATEISYALNRKAHVVLTLREDKKVLETLLDTRVKKEESGGEMIEPGVYTLPFNAAKLGMGNYRLVMEAEGEGYPQPVEAADLLTVIWRD